MRLAAPRQRKAMMPEGSRPAHFRIRSPLRCIADGSVLSASAWWNARRLMQINACTSDTGQPEHHRAAAPLSPLHFVNSFLRFCDKCRKNASIPAKSPILFEKMLAFSLQI